VLWSGTVLVPAGMVNVNGLLCVDKGPVFMVTETLENIDPVFVKAVDLMQKELGPHELFVCG